MSEQRYGPGAGPRVWWHECEHCHSRFMLKSSLDEHVCIYKRLSELEAQVERLTQDNAQMLEALDRLRNRIQNERDMSCGGAWIGVAPGQHLKDAIDEAGDVLAAAARTEGGR